MVTYLELSILKSRLRHMQANYAQSKHGAVRQVAQDISALLESFDFVREPPCFTEKWTHIEDIWGTRVLVERSANQKYLDTFSYPYTLPAGSGIDKYQCQMNELIASLPELVRENAHLKNTLQCILDRNNKNDK